eukprot:332460-Heterocapsa_arctica.AAC.1
MQTVHRRRAGRGHRGAHAEGQACRLDADGARSLAGAHRRHGRLRGQARHVAPARRPHRHAPHRGLGERPGGPLVALGGRLRHTQNEAWASEYAGVVP